MKFVFMLILAKIVSIQAHADNNQEELIRVRLMQSQGRIHITGSLISVNGEPSRPSMSVNLEVGDGVGELRVDGINMRINGVRVPEKVFIFNDQEKNKFSVVGLIPLETYVVGVLHGEMPASWPIEALKAQAVAARSYVQFQKLVPRHPYFDVESTVYDQVFQHIKKPSAKIVKAVQATSSQILRDPMTGKTLKAFFHAHCGGHTLRPTDVWGGDGEDTHIPAVKDPFCERRYPKPWARRLSENQFLQALDQGFELGVPVASLDLKKIDDNVTTIRVQAGRSTLRYTANSLRKTLGYGRLKSAKFEVLHDKRRKSLTFQGRGHGHGVGLCQWGARAMADEGHSYRDILNHYYGSEWLLADSKF